MPSLYLIDAHAYLHRAYHALPPLTTSRGEPVGAVYGFMRMLGKILKQHKPDYLAVCFDTAAPTLRHHAFADYKATRKEIDEPLKSQFPLAREAVAAMGLPQFERDGFEADDVIAHLAREGVSRDLDVVIVSGDKDALQLVTDRIKVLNESKDILFDVARVEAEWGVRPEQIPDIFALMGDASDNIPGVKGIGEKTAVKLIQEYGSLEKLLSSAANVPGKTGELLKSRGSDARASYELVRLHHAVPVTVDWDACRVKPVDPAALSAFLQRLEFHALLRELAPSGPVTVDTSRRDYRTLLSEKDLQDWVRRAQNAERLAIDVETNGLDSLNCALVGISLSTAPGSAAYIPLRHQGLGQPQQLPLSAVQSILGPLLKGSGPKLYGHNLKFDIEVLRRHGLPVGRLCCDTMVASYVLNPSRNAHGLKELAQEYLGEVMVPIDQLIGKGAKQITMEDVPIEKAAPYACADTDMTLRLADVFEPRIREKGLFALFYDIEMPLVSILADMEEQGIRVDRPYLESLGRTWQETLAGLEAQIYAQAGERFNVNSPKQLAHILFEKLQLPVIRRTKSGFSTDEEVLQKLASQHALPKTIIRHRELQKLHSTYVVGLLAASQGAASRVHTSFNQTVAATGRLSSSDPNLQNIPIRTEIGRMIRKAFVPSPGHVLLSADYSQIDLRMLAHISGDAALKESFRKGEDVHVRTASEIFNVPASHVTAEQRRIAKSINFGIVYGMSAYGLAQQLELTPDVTQDYINRYFARYAGVKRWMEKIVEDARRDGYVKTLLGRIRYLPDIESKNAAIRGFAERTAMNTPIQGTSADVIKVAMIHLARAQEKGLWKGHLLLQVHDELVFDIPAAERHSVIRPIRERMETAVKLEVPVVVNFKAGPNWAEMEPVD